jgi:hypothetical protein
MLVEKLADKVNARGDTPAERLAAVEHRVDEVATHGVRLGTTLGLAAMADKCLYCDDFSSCLHP